MGQVDPLAANTHQIRDFNLGIAPGGLFWTTPLPDYSIQTNMATGTGSYKVNSLPVQRYTDLAHALGIAGDGSWIPANVSFDLEWSGTQNPTTLRDTTNRFSGQYFLNTATIFWMASEPGFVFISDPASTSASYFSQFGQESNGVFFS